MPLLYVHKIMIGTAVVFCALFGWRCLALGELSLGIGSVVTAGTLAIYLRWFLRGTRRENSGRPADDSQA